MALATLPFDPVKPPPGILPTASNYRSVYDFASQWFPELANQLFRVRSRGSLQGFLSGMAQEEGISADKYFWAEEGERHVIHESVVARAGNVFTYADHEIRPNQKILVHDKAGDAWALARVTSTTATTFTAEPYAWDDFNNVTLGMGTANLTVFTAGSEFAKGTDGQTESLEMQVDIYDNKPIIEKDVFKINNSDLTNITWFKVDGNYYWYDEQFDETMDRFMDELEISHLTAEKTDAASSLSGTYEGAEGYFSALRNRGVTQQGLITSTADWEAIIKVLDRVHGENSYYAYVSRDQTNAIDKWLASLNAYDATVNTNYGIFENRGESGGEQTALELGFKGFMWNDYSFYKQTWSVLKDPTKFGSVALADSGTVHGVLFPHGNTPTAYNPIHGTPATRVPYLTLMYKEMPGYSRKMESFFIGSGRIATPTTSGDYLELNLRSERSLRVVGARKQFIITG